MNFEMQDLVGSWVLVGGEIGKIDSINMQGNSSNGWKPRYPVNLRLLVKRHDGETYWVHGHKAHYLDQLDIIPPEVAEIYMQANNLSIPKRINI